MLRTNKDSDTNTAFGTYLKLIMTIEYQNSANGCNSFRIANFVEFDQNGRALCPSCAPHHSSTKKTLSLVPNTDGAYKCFRGCTPTEIRAALGQAKPTIIPTALTKPAPSKKTTVSREKVVEMGILASSPNQYQIEAINWLEAKGIGKTEISKHKLGLTRAKIGSKMHWSITIPIPDGQGEYYLKKRVSPWDTVLAKTGAYRPWKQYGIPSMVYFTYKPENSKETWLCEGEWDAINLAKLVRDKRSDVAVACFTCGCSSVPSQKELDRLPGDVTIFYDRNDKPLANGDRPGEVGAKKVALALGGRAKIAQVPMSQGCQVSGWDVSDAIKEGFILESFERAATEACFVGEEYKNDFINGLRKLSELYETAPDYVDWLVPDLLTTNELYCLAAEPRAGKSLFALGLAKAIATGGKFLDRPCQQGEVVYICKEDPDDKVKERLIAQEWTAEEMERVTIHNDFTLENLPSLVEYVRVHQPSLIVMDTLSRVNPNASCENSSEIVDILAPLQNLASKENVCILVVHHTRKKSNVETDVLDIFDSVRGSGAIRATCRGMLVLCKAKENYRLAVENGRTAVQDLKVHLNVADLNWRLNGFWSPPSVNLSQKEIILQWFQKHLEGSIEDVFAGTMIRKKYIYEILTRLANEKMIQRTGKQRNTRYFYVQVPQVPQVEDEWNSPNPGTEGNTSQFHKLPPDPENLEQTDQKCNNLLISDQVDQKIEINSNLVELEGKEGQIVVTNSISAVPQSSTISSTVELKDEKEISVDCSKNFSEQENSVLQEDFEHEVDQVASLEELQELEDRIEGIYHKKKGYLKFIRFEGKRIIGRKSGMGQEHRFYWNGCTGKIELKK